MADHNSCKFVVLNMPWQNLIKLLENKCQAINLPKNTPPTYKMNTPTLLLQSDHNQVEGSPRSKKWMDSYLYTVIVMSVALLTISLFCMYHLHSCKHTISKIFYLLNKRER